MGASLAVELQKMARRPAAWVVGLILLVLVALFGYLLSYIFIAGVEGDPPPERRAVSGPSSTPRTPSSTCSSSSVNFGVALTLVLGALSVGSEYGWETFKLVLTQKPGRLPYFLGKLLSLAVVVAIFTLLSFVLGAGCSYVVATLQEEAVEWPSFVDVLKALGAGWLILATFAAMGLFFATLFRGSALAIGLGLVYLLVLESLFAGLAPQSETLRVHKPGAARQERFRSEYGVRGGAGGLAALPSPE